MEIAIPKKVFFLLPLLLIPALGAYFYLVGEINSELVYLLLTKVGNYAPLIYFFLHLARPASFIPSSLLVVGAGLVFDPVMGLILCFAGLLCAYTLVYIVGKKCGQSWLDIKYPEASKKLRNKLKTNNIFVLSTVRLIPVLPADLVSYTSGALGIRYLNFIIGTFLGSVPGTVLMFFAAAGIRMEFLPF